MPRDDSRPTEDNARSGLKNGVPAFPDRLAWGLDTRQGPTAQDRSACLRLFETTSRGPASSRPAPLPGRGETGWMARTPGGREPQRGSMPREDSRPTEDNARRPVSPRPAPPVALAITGVYGVLAYGVARRQREIGIRMALGARRSVVAAMVLRQGVAIAAAGVVAGAGAALLLT